MVNSSLVALSIRSKLFPLTRFPLDWLLEVFAYYFSGLNNERNVLKRNEFKDVLRRKKKQFYLYLHSWRGISSVQGFPCRIKCPLPDVSKTSNEIIIINKFLRTTTLKIMICSFRLYFHVVFFSKPIKM